MKLPQFVPILTSFTARVAGRDVEELLRSASALARAIGETQQVVGHDGVLCFYQPSLLMSACRVAPPPGTSGVQWRAAEEIVRAGPFAPVLEALPALRHRLPETASLFATFAGPGLLFDTLSAPPPPSQGAAIDLDDVSDVILTVVRASLEAKADGVAFIEQLAGVTPSKVLSLYKTVRKLTDFYEAGFLVFLEAGTVPFEVLNQPHCLFDLTSVATDDDLVAGRVSTPPSHRVVPMTTARDVPADTPVETLRTWRARAERSEQS